jgi:hypothetical protein
MAIIHTIEVATGTGETHTETRKSASHHYVACLVRTVTEETVRHEQESRAKAQAMLEANKATVAELTAKQGVTVEQAKAAHKEAVEAWKPNYRTAEYPKCPIMDAAWEVERLTRNLSEGRLSTVGRQVVMSWHHSKLLANRALSGRDAQWARESGYTVEVRTDIAVRETAKKAKAS